MEFVTHVLFLMEPAPILNNVLGVQRVQTVFASVLSTLY